jgi:aminoethylphosphonate catabolism LysR family transcriptional regulator
MFTAQLKAFFTVARLGSVTLAAKQLGISQPTVTTQIRALEVQYGLELFRRNSGRLTISDAGIELLPMVEGLLQQESQIEFALRNQAELRQGSLRIGATAPYYMLDLVQRFQCRYPGINLSLHVGNSCQMVDALREYRVDLAASSHLVRDARLLCWKLGEDPLVLVLRSDHALAHLTSVTPQDLTPCRLLLRETGSTTRQLGEEMLEQAGVRVAHVMEIGSRESLREAIVRGMGVSLVARHEVPHHPDLRMLPLRDVAPMVREYLYVLKERRQMRLVEAFLSTAELPLKL